MSISTTAQTLGHSLSVAITHAQCSSPLPAGTAVIQVFETSPNGGFDTVTTVSFPDRPEYLRIELYWRTIPFCGESVDVLAIEATGLLFLGAGATFAVVDLPHSRVISQHSVTLFWDFANIKHSILVRSELECFVFGHDGTMVGSVPVDPPWEETITEQGIAFSSPVYGHRFLPWSAA